MKTSIPTVLIRILSLFFFFLLLCFPSQALAGASTGLLLWFQTVLPTLLPGMILADFLLRIGADRYLTRLISRPFRLLLGLSTDGCYGVLVGFLCGYPMGAKTVAGMLAEDRISRREASYLLAFTNQPSSLFLTGYLCLSLFGQQDGRMHILTVLSSIYGSAILISFLYRAVRRMDHHLRRRWDSDLSGDRSPLTSPIARQTEPRHNKSADPSLLTQLETSMMTSCEVMVKIGGYMMLFSIGEAFVQNVPYLGIPFKSILMGLVEMTTGCRHIATAIEYPWSLALCSGAIAFGGLSGFAQTANVLKGSGLSAGHYFYWKALQGILTAILVLLCLFVAGQYPAVY